MMSKTLLALLAVHQVGFTLAAGGPAVTGSVTVLTDWDADTTNAWTDRTSKLKDLGEFTTCNYDYFMSSTVNSRTALYSFTLDAAATVVVLADDGGTGPTLTGWTSCTGEVGYGVVGSTTYWDKQCKQKDFQSGETVSIQSASAKTMAFIKKPSTASSTSTTSSATSNVFAIYPTIDSAGNMVWPDCTTCSTSDCTSLASNQDWRYAKISTGSSPGCGTCPNNKEPCRIVADDYWVNQGGYSTDTIKFMCCEIGKGYSGGALTNTETWGGQYFQTKTGHHNNWDGLTLLTQRGLMRFVMNAKTLDGTISNFAYETGFVVYCNTRKYVACSKKTQTTSLVTYAMEPYADLTVSVSSPSPSPPPARTCIVQTSSQFSSLRARCAGNLDGATLFNKAEDDADWKYGVVGVADLQNCATCSTGTCNVRNNANTIITTDQCGSDVNVIGTGSKLTYAAIVTRLKKVADFHSSSGVCTGISALL